jgi:hypothetical protein
VQQKNCKIDSAAEFCGRNILENTCGTIWVTQFDKMHVLIIRQKSCVDFNSTSFFKSDGFNVYCLVVSSILCIDAKSHALSV